MNRGWGAAGGRTGAARTGETTASEMGAKKPTTAARSACTVTVGTAILNGTAPSAAGQPGQCFPGHGPDGPCVGAGCSSPCSGKVNDVCELRHESHAQSGGGFVPCATEVGLLGDVDQGVAGAVPIGTSRQMHMPGGMSVAGSVRSRTNVRNIASPSSLVHTNGGIIPTGPKAVNRKPDRG